MAEGFSCCLDFKCELHQKYTGLELGTILIPAEGW